MVRTAFPACSVCIDICFADVALDMGGVDAQAEFFEPLQKALDLSRSAKVLSKKLIKRVEDLTQDSMALKAHFVPQLQALTNTVPELVNFGISVRLAPFLSTSSPANPGSCSLASPTNHATSQRCSGLKVTLPAHHDFGCR